MERGDGHINHALDADGRSCLIDGPPALVRECAYIDVPDGETFKTVPSIVALLEETGSDQPQPRPRSYSMAADIPSALTDRVENVDPTDRAEAPPPPTKVEIERFEASRSCSFNRDFAGAADCAVGDTFADPVFGNLGMEYVDPRIGYATLKYPNWRRNIPNAKLATRLLSGYVLRCRQRFRGIPLPGKLRAQERIVSATQLPSAGTPNLRVFTHRVAEQLESDEEWLMATRQQGFKVSHQSAFRPGSHFDFTN